MHYQSKESFAGLFGWFSYPIVGCILVSLSYLVGKLEIGYIVNPSTLKGDDLIGLYIVAGFLSAVVGGLVAFNSKAGKWWERS